MCIRDRFISWIKHFQSCYLETTGRICVLTKILNSVHGCQHFGFRWVVLQVEVQLRFVSLWVKHMLNKWRTIDNVQFNNDYQSSTMLLKTRSLLYFWNNFTKYRSISVIFGRQNLQRLSNVKCVAWKSWENRVPASVNFIAPTLHCTS